MHRPHLGVEMTTFLSSRAGTLSCSICTAPCSYPQEKAELLSINPLAGRLGGFSVLPQWGKKTKMSCSENALQKQLASNVLLGVSVVWTKFSPKLCRNSFILWLKSIRRMLAVLRIPNNNSRKSGTGSGGGTGLLCCCGLPWAPDSCCPIKIIKLLVTYSWKATPSTE